MTFYVKLCFEAFRNVARKFYNVNEIVTVYTEYTLNVNNVKQKQHFSQAKKFRRRLLYIVL